MKLQLKRFRIGLGGYKLKLLGSFKLTINIELKLNPLHFLIESEIFIGI